MFPSRGACCSACSELFAGPAWDLGGWARSSVRRRRRSQAGAAWRLHGWESQRHGRGRGDVGPRLGPLPPCSDGGDGTEGSVGVGTDAGSTVLRAGKCRSRNPAGCRGHQTVVQEPSFLSPWGRARLTGVSGWLSVPGPRPTLETNAPSLSTVLSHLFILPLLYLGISALSKDMWLTTIF